MSAIIKTLKTKTDDIEQNVYPRTILDAVVDRTSGKTLNVLLDENMPEGAVYTSDESEPETNVDAVTSASYVSYSNTDSGLEATNVQEAIDEINETKVNTADIVDNLESTATNLPLSAKQGKVVNDKVDDYIRENLLTYPFHDTTLSRNGITFTDNGDGTITVNGTNTSANIVDYAIAVRLGAVGVTAKNPTILSAGTYTLSGCPEGGSDSTYCLRTGTDDANLNYKDFGKDYGQGITFTTDGESQIGVFIYIAAGVTVNNLTFKPMLEVGTVAHEYKPYSLNRLTKGDIVDNLLSNRADLPLSANQGRVISEKISANYISSTDVYIDNYISNDGLHFWVIEYTDYVLVSIVAKLNETLNIDGWTTVISGLPNVTRPTPLNVFNSVTQTRDITVLYMNNTIVFVTQKDINYVVEGDYIYISGVVVK